MSDLCCPATLLVARHAEAEYPTGLVGDHGGSLTPLGRMQARRLGDSLRDRRVAAIWCSDMARSVQTAEIAAARLDVPVQVRPGLREFAVGSFAGQPFDPELFEPVWAAWLVGDLSVGCPDAETGGDVVRRMQIEMAEAADCFRGETALLVSHGDAMWLALSRLAGNVPDVWPQGRRVPNAECAEMVVDADGWTLRSWAGRPV